MREFKFKAFNRKTKRMLNLYDITPLALDIECDGVFIPFEDHIEIIQYTGMKDCDGVEIYEGYILNNNDDILLCPWLISFRDGCYGVQNISINKKLSNWFFRISKDDVSSRRIIGNIYENPELTEVEDDNRK